MAVSPLPARASAPAACETESAGPAFEVTVTGIRNAKGQISINLYGEPGDRFMKKGAWLERVRLPAQAGEVRVCVPAPAPGLYAISLFHDEDGDGRLDQNWIGIPTEGFGFSRDAPAPLRLPRFEEAAVALAEEISPLTISVRY